MSDKQRLIENTKKMRKYSEMSFIHIIKRALLINKPNIKRNITIIIILCIIQYPLIKNVFSNNTVDIIKDIINFTNNIALAIFSAVVTGYALFQALVNKNTLKVMFLQESNSLKNDNHNLFIEYNLYFLVFCFLCIISIIMNYIIEIYIPIFKGITTGFLSEYKNYICIVAMNIYFYFNLYLLLEVKSFIFNLFKCFNMNAISTITDSLDDWDEDLYNKSHSEIINNIASQIEKIVELRERGEITEDEYQNIKNKILNS